MYVLKGGGLGTNPFGAQDSTRAQIHAGYRL